MKTYIYKIRLNSIIGLDPRYITLSIVADNFLASYNLIYDRVKKLKHWHEYYRGEVDVNLLDIVNI